MSFSHTDAGTSEEAWAAAGVGALPALEAPAWDADTLLLVAVAHPDDETLGATGLIRSALRGGARVHVLVATAGEAWWLSWPAASAKCSAAASRS